MTLSVENDTVSHQIMFIAFSVSIQFFFFANTWFQELTIKATKADIESNSESLPPLRNPPILEATEDLTSLSYLNEPAVLHAIRMRYSQLNIYTYSGIVLIATNPFQRIDSLYTPDIIQAYSGRTRGELEPHLFAIAEDAYRCMLRDNANQTIVVSGESGAGKTVSAKYIMRYFATVEDPERPRKKSKFNNLEAMDKTEQQILATNPIMEAFGNAKTIRNDNSSRFGKYLEILFNEDVDIIGAKIRTYLLERSRLVFQPPSERNYHIFYQLLAGSSDEDKEKLGLTDVAAFNYINQGGEPEIANVDDAAEFNATKQALLTIGINEETQSEIFRILAALLHLGNVQITPTRTNAILNSDEPSLVKACELLGLDPVSFAKWTTKKQITTRSEKIISNLNHQQSVVVRDSVSKFIYSSIFDWLVYSINNSLCTPEIQQHIKTFIGVLDIYGFEHFKKNSFEQFCINYANEKLQQEFNQHVFKLEQDEYVNEEIEWNFIDFSDNQPCITLIEAKLGILSLLDEESRLPSGSDESWIGKLYQNFDQPTHAKFFKKPRFGKSAFIVNHYAMEVTYESEGFIEKNRDSVPDEHMEVLTASTNPFFKGVIEYAQELAASTEKAAAPATKSRITINRKPTLGGIFKSSLIDLMNTINSTNVHYIRCIKPNESKSAWLFDGPMVLSQLRACGVLETIRISCDGFPTRWTYEEFASRYFLLIPSTQWVSEAKEFCDRILQKSLPSIDKYQLGKTKIFFRAGMLAHLEKLRSDRLNESAIVIQKNLRMIYYRKQYQLIRNSIIAVQTFSRGFIARQNALNLRQSNAAVLIQKSWRGHQQRLSYQQTRSSVIKAQAAIRGYLYRRRVLEENEAAAATTIQRHWRGYAARKEYQDTKKKVTILQGLWRIKLAKRTLNALREEARSVNHYKEVQYTLESKVVELTQTMTAHRSENKKLKETIEALNAQVALWQSKHIEASSQLDSLETKALDSEKVNRDAIASLQSAMELLQQKHDRNLAEYEAIVKERDAIKAELAENKAALQTAKVDLKEFESSNQELLATIEQLRRDLDHASRGPPAYPGIDSASVGLPQWGQNGTMQFSANKRNTKRRSLINTSNNKDPANFAPRPASVIFTEHKTQNSIGSDSDAEYNAYNLEIETLLDDYKNISQEVVHGIITNLKIPVPPTSDDVPPKEILFPAHIISLVTSEMWRMGYVKESEAFLGQVMQAIQETVLKYSGEDIINPGAFWISNVHEIWSFICVAQVNIVENELLLEEMGEKMFEDYSKLVDLAKRDLESLEFNIYHAWMKELKKTLDKMIIPAVILSQSLPGFMTQENSRFLAKMFNTNGPTATMDDLLSLLNKVHKAMTGYFLSPEFIKQPILELLRLIGVKSFNDLLMRRAFSSWKRGLQINYNITRIEEWCKANNISEGIIRLEHITESVKLLQLKKSTLDDIDIIYDICWTLTPLQIQRLISQYLTADYEPPISNEILNMVALKVKSDENPSALMLDQIPLDDSGPFELVEPRQLERLDSYVPAWLQVPKVKRLSELTALVNSRYFVAEEELHANGQQHHGFEEDEDRLEEAAPLGDASNITMEFGDDVPTQIVHS